MEAQAAARKAAYDIGAKEHPLAVGQRVWLRNRARGRNKIQDWWDPQVFIVVGKTGTSHNVYTIEPENGNGAARNVNRVNLKPCPAPRTNNEPLLRRSACPYDSSSNHDDPQSSEDETESQDEYVVVTGMPEPREYNLRSRPSEQSRPSPVQTNESSPDLDLIGNDEYDVELDASSNSAEQANSTDNVDDVTSEQTPEVTHEEPRSSVRSTSGQHSNPYHEPRSAALETTEFQAVRQDEEFLLQMSTRLMREAFSLFKSETK